jgi:hypothetical protein
MECFSPSWKEKREKEKKSRNENTKDVCGSMEWKEERPDFSPSWKMKPETRFLSKLEKKRMFEKTRCNFQK